MKIYIGIILLITVINFFFEYFQEKYKAIGENKLKKIYVLICFFLLFFISAFRATSVGTDTFAYQKLFLKTIAGVNTGFEVGFIMFCQIVSFFSETPRAILIAMSLMTIGLIMIYIFFNSSNVYLSVYLFVALYFWATSMNQGRQFLSIAIMLNAETFLRRKKYFFSTVLMIIAISIHSTAWLPISILLTCYVFKPDLKKSVIIFIGLILMIFLTDRLIDFIVYFYPRLIVYTQIDSNYLEISSGVSATRLGISMLLIYIMGILFRPKEKQLIYDKYLFFVASASAVSLLSGVMLAFYRFSFSLNIFSIIAIPEFIENGKVKGYKKYFVKFVIYILGFVYFYYVLSIGSEGIVPYKTILF